MKNNKKALAALMCLSLAACGGGGGSNGDEDTLTTPIEVPPPTFSATGRAIDGYLVGATAWLDIDGDGVLGEDEPRAETTTGGEYDLQLSEAQLACLPYSTLYVDVPVGATDESEGEVLEAYQLAFPPSLDGNKTDNIMVTPLTTVVWQGVQLALRQSGFSLSCASVQADEVMRNRIQGAIETAINGVVRHYNLSAETIFKDYIADGDTEIQQKAVEIVRGLQASLAATIELWEANPSADYLLVQYYQGSYLDNGEDYLPEQWYREEYVWEGGTSMHRVARVSDDLQTETALILSAESTAEFTGTFSWNDGSVWESRSGDGTYQCERSRGIEWDMSALHTLYDTSAVTDEAGCRQPPAGAVQTQYNFVGYEESGVRYVAQFAFDGFENIPLPASVDDVSVTEFDSTLQGLPYRWDEQGVAGAMWVARNRTESFAEGEVASIRTSRMEYQDGTESWSRRTENRDGTHVSECSMDGQEWLPEGDCG